MNCNLLREEARLIRVEEEGEDKAGAAQGDGGRRRLEGGLQMGWKRIC